jgi:riboflavin synthase
MFTGIIHRRGKVVSAKKNRGVFELTVNSPEFTADVKIGDSIAVNGVFLTVTRKQKTTATFEVIEETLRKTNLSELRKGSGVNLERSLRLSDRLDGHIVMGHVDGIGTIIRREPEKDGSTKIWIRSTPKLTAGMVQKGPIALDGVSLTLVDVLKDRFSVCIIPHTAAATNIINRNVGDSVNVEVYTVGKYVRKFMFMKQLNLQTRGGKA